MENMKNMVELPTEADFYETTLISDVQDAFSGASIIKYKKTAVALRSVIDFNEFEKEVEVVDEEKYPDYLKRVEEFKSKIMEKRQGSDFMPGLENMVFDPENPALRRPEPPLKKITLTGCSVLYLNGASKIIVDHYEDFKEKYFKYLKLQKLDITG